MDIFLERTTHQNFGAARFKGSKIEKNKRNICFIFFEKKTKINHIRKIIEQTKKKTICVFVLVVLYHIYLVVCFRFFFFIFFRCFVFF